MTKCENPCRFIRIENRSQLPVGFKIKSHGDWLKDKYAGKKWWQRLSEGGTNDLIEYGFWCLRQEEDALLHFRRYQCGGCGEIKEYRI